MPKRKRSESVGQWTVNGGTDSDGDVVDGSHGRDIETTKGDNNNITIALKLKPIDSNNTTVGDIIAETEPMTSAAELMPKNVGTTPRSGSTVVNSLYTNGLSLSPNLDENISQSLSRRKSNRISKPIQRSMELSSTTTSPNSSTKKIAKQHMTQNSVNNCESNDRSVVKKSEDNANHTKGSKGGRKLQMWTNDDTKWFFEAIAEHGKDFPRIQSYMAQRCEKKGIPTDQIKNYEQVRHYYYRMWHKIANSLLTNEVVDKNIQEIYGLINYGEIWKKFGTKYDNKLTLNLQQLVNFGHTTFKVKGKNLRVKTPICNALKKIHKINVANNTKTNDSPSLSSLPKEVTIELHPVDNESWLRVHSLSQNPRVRTKMSLQKRLYTLVDYLERRWSQSRIKDSECRTICGTPLDQNLPVVEKWALRVRPHSSHHLNSVSLSKSYFNSQMDLSLTAYLKTLYNHEMNTKSKRSKSSNKTKDSNRELKSPNCEQTGDQQRDNNNEDKSDDKTDDKMSEDKKSEDKSCVDNSKSAQTVSPTIKSTDSEVKSDEDEPIAEAERSLTLLRMLEKMNAISDEIHAIDEDDDKEDDDQNKEEEDRDFPSPEANVLCLPEPPANATLAQWLSSGYGEDNDENDENEETDGCNDNLKKASVTTETTIENQMSLLSADRARKGWSVSETGAMTIGELYLLFRCPKTIHLEYCWESIVSVNCDIAHPGEDTTTANTTTNEDSIVTSSDDIKTNVDSNKTESSNKSNTTTDLLYKLLLAANVSLSRLKRPSNGSTSQTQKKKRIKPTQLLPALLSSAPLVLKPADNSSQILSNVIQNTIFNDNSNSNEANNKQQNSLTNLNDSKIVSILQDNNFPMPTTPAPKAVNKTKGRNVCDASIQEALKQLQSHKYTRRHRRALSKPVFNGQIKPLLPRGSSSAMTIATTTATVTQNQPIYVLPSHSLTLNALSSAVTSQSSSQSLPVIGVTSLTTSSTLRQSLEARNPVTVDTYNVFLPQKSPLDDSNHNNNISNNSNIPLINLDVIQSVSVPIISSSSTNNTTASNLGQQTLNANSFSIVDHKSITLSSGKTNHVNNLDLPTISLGSDVSQVLNKSIKNENQTISSSDESSEKLPLISTAPTISSLLEISLPEPPFSNNSCSSFTDGYTIDKRPFERLTLTTDDIVAAIDHQSNHNNSIHKSCTNMTDPTLATSVSSSSSLASPPIERNKLNTSPVVDTHWLNGDSNELSLGTLLNTCESPVKTMTIRDNSSLTNDVSISGMSCLVTDNSVDMIAKFADLAAHIGDSNSKST
ncbi:protein cramped-like [Oppia nitens]|uniref:protein cramped-like n=1 Tax=Oppia nitens TaxID=1686743 RepID=UPI0023DA822B|nr:protein cramped-like [Oppia nitens]